MRASDVHNSSIALVDRRPLRADLVEEVRDPRFCVMIRDEVRVGELDIRPCSTAATTPERVDPPARSLASAAASPERADPPPETYAAASQATSAAARRRPHIAASERRLLGVCELFVGRRAKATRAPARARRGLDSYFARQGPDLARNQQRRDRANKVQVQTLERRGADDAASNATSRADAPARTVPDGRDAMSLLKISAAAQAVADVLARWFYYVVLAALMGEYRLHVTTPRCDRICIFVCRCLGSKCETWDEWLEAHGADMGTPRNCIVLGLAFGCSEFLKPGAAHSLLCTAAAICLWNFGKPIPFRDAPVLVANFLHHVGAIIALSYHVTEHDPRSGALYRAPQHRRFQFTQARLNTIFFTYLWVCHGFALLNDVFMPKPKPGEKRKKLLSLQILRYVYALGSVYWFRRFIQRPPEPGLGANYQTASVAVILAGRQSFGIFLSVPFMKNIELPLMTLVAVYELAATGRPVAAAATLAVVVAFVLFWRRNRVDWRKEPGDEKTKQRRKKRESLRMSFVGSEPLTLKEIHDSLRGDDGESAATRREDKAD